MDINIIILISIIVGCILRTLIPYLTKISSGEIQVFDKKFLASFALAIVLGIVAGITIFPSFIIPTGPVFMIIIAALLWGWGSQSIINTVVTTTT